MPTWVKFNESVLGVGKRSFVRGEYAYLKTKVLNSLRVEWFDYVAQPTELELARAKRSSRQREAQEKRTLPFKTNPVTGAQRRKDD